MNDEIQVLSEMEAVRQNPWMYIGSVGEDGLHHLLSEVVHNALDEATLGHCDRIRVKVGDQYCEVEDNGRGIPTDTHRDLGIPSCEVALTRLHSGSKFRKQPDRFTAGLHGVGLSAVNALSSELSLEIRRDGRQFVQKYARGKPLHGLQDAGAAQGQGTRLRFTPDPEIFRGADGFDAAKCRDFVEDLALLNPGVEIYFLDEKRKEESSFFSEGGGLSGLWKKYGSGRRQLLPDPVEISVQNEDLRCEALVSWTTDTEPTYATFVNCVRTPLGGTHLNALRAGIVKAVNRMLVEVGRSAWQGSQAEMEEVCEGLLAVLHCKVARPNFEGQTKSRFTNVEVAGAIEIAAGEQLSAFFRRNPKAAEIVFGRISEARNARSAAKRAADRIYYQHGRKEINEEVYKEQFGARSKNWHQSAVWITHEELLQSHGDLCAVGPDAVALDVCCGSGVVGASFKGKVKKVIGLDLTPEMVELASERLDEVVQGNVYNIPFPENSFDLVCTREVLHLLPYPERPVSEIFRVLKPGGQFVVGQILPFSEEDAAWMYRVFKKKQPLIFNMFQEEDFRRMLLSAGFTDLEMTEMNVWESIDVWIDSYETTAIHRHEIRELFRQAPAEARAVHPFKIGPNGEIQDLWRWCVFSVRKPGN